MPLMLVLGAGVAQRIHKVAQSWLETDTDLVEYLMTMQKSHK